MEELTEKTECSFRGSIIWHPRTLRHHKEEEAKGHAAKERNVEIPDPRLKSLRSTIPTVVVCTLLWACR